MLAPSIIVAVVEISAVVYALQCLPKIVLDRRACVENLWCAECVEALRPKSRRDFRKQIFPLL